MSEYFPKPSSHKESTKVKIDLINYATKEDIKNITHLDTSRFALKTNLSSLKFEVDKLDIDKLVPIPNDLAKLSNVVKNDVVKKAVYNKLVAKVDNINTNGFVLKTNYSTDKTELENKIRDISGLVTKAQLNVVENKIARASDLVTTNDLITIENEIPNTYNIASKYDLTVVENKIPNISNLATKTALTTVEK